MKGTIEIKLVDNLAIEMGIHGRFNKLERLCIIDSLVKHLCRDETERAAVCAVIVAGGVEKVFPGEKKEITLSPELGDFLKKKGYMNHEDV